MDIRSASSHTTLTSSGSGSVSPPHTVTSPALPDTGAQIMADIDLVHKLGNNRKEPSPVTSGIKAVRDLVRGLLVTISGSHMF